MQPQSDVAVVESHLGERLDAFEAVVQGGAVQGELRSGRAGVARVVQPRQQRDAQRAVGVLAGEPHECGSATQLVERLGRQQREVRVCADLAEAGRRGVRRHSAGHQQRGPRLGQRPRQLGERGLRVRDTGRRLGGFGDPAGKVGRLRPCGQRDDEQELTGHRDHVERVPGGQKPPQSAAELGRGGGRDDRHGCRDHEGAGADEGFGGAVLAAQGGVQEHVTGSALLILVVPHATEDEGGGLRRQDGRVDVLLRDWVTGLVREPQEPEQALRVPHRHADPRRHPEFGSGGQPQRRVGRVDAVTTHPGVDVARAAPGQDRAAANRIDLVVVGAVGEHAQVAILEIDGAADALRELVDLALQGVVRVGCHTEVPVRSVVRDEVEPVGSCCTRRPHSRGDPMSTTDTAGRLIAIDDLGPSQVAVIEDTPHGALAVGMSGAEPFAVSNRCRHLFASLGKGKVDADGCLECPWHGALFDVSDGSMVRGPQGAFKPISGAVKGTLGARKLKTYPVEVRDGAIWLT